MSEYERADENPLLCTHPNKKVDVRMDVVVVWCPDCYTILETKTIEID